MDNKSVLVKCVTLMMILKRPDTLWERLLLWRRHFIQILSLFIFNHLKLLPLRSWTRALRECNSDFIPQLPIQIVRELGYVQFKDFLMCNDLQKKLMSISSTILRAYSHFVAYCYCLYFLHQYLCALKLKWFSQLHDK